jgi:hypothetical protein
MKKQVLGGSLMTLAGLTQAAVPASVTTAITDAGADAVTVATAVFVVLVGIFAVKLMRRGL